MARFGHHPAGVEFFRPAALYAPVFEGYGVRNALQGHKNSRVAIHGFFMLTRMDCMEALNESAFFWVWFLKLC